MRQETKDKLEKLISIISPEWAYKRAQNRFAYDVLDKSRLRKKRKYSNRGGDSELNETNLDQLRQIARDLSKNNPIIKGLFKKLATNVVGTDTRIQARTSDKKFNEEAEAVFKEEMIENPCDITGRYNFHGLLYKGYYRYEQDGDCLCLFLDEGPQMIQGERCGTPYSNKVEVDPKYFEVTNGVAVSKQTGKIIGYYIGKPNKWGYIKNEDYKKYPVDIVHHIANFEQFDHSRGEPMLTSAIDTIDKLFGYVDAELVAAKINACFPVVSYTKDGKGFTGNLGNMESLDGTNQQDEYNRTKVRIEPGQILEGEPGEKYEALGASRPSQAFDQFTMRMLMFVGAPLCMPLMMVTGDYSHATFMNARFAYLFEGQPFWKTEQEFVTKPFAKKLWLWKIKQRINSGDLKGAPKDWYKHEIFMKRWPYVDPYREAQADKLRLEDGTITRQIIVSRQDGLDWKEEIYPQWQEERTTISASAPMPKIIKEDNKEDNEDDSDTK